MILAGRAESTARRRLFRTRHQQRAGREGRCGSAYDIDRLVVNANLAKVDVWERGYFYASAAQKTYELAADTMFVLEKQAGGRLADPCA